MFDSNKEQKIKQSRITNDLRHEIKKKCEKGWKGGLMEKCND